VLELGTATGYSAIWLARGLGPHGTLTTIELDPNRAEQARNNFKRWFGETVGTITLLEGDALAILPTLENPFDLIFIDAAKGQYPDFLQQVERLLVPGGVLVADNVLFRGMVDKQQEQIEKRYRTLVRRLRQFLELLLKHPDWDTTILPLGDGVSLSYKRNWD
jgi:predicted O-methyltransferase YrrM